MEVSHAPGMPSGLAFVPNGQAIDEPDTMDIDMDIDLGPIDDNHLMQSTLEQSLLQIQPEQNDASEAQEPQVAAEDAIPHKIHIRGLDDLTTDHIKSFTAEHFPLDSPSRIEWIDDTSANIVFGTPAVALRALEQLTHPAYNGSLPELQLRPAKQFTQFPRSTLEVRLALATDQKAPRAYEASRFYMMHPELDPREQRHREGRKSERNDYRRRKYGQDEHRRRRRDDRDQGFDPTMYDDDVGALASRNDNPKSRRDSASMLSTNSSEIANSTGDRRHGGYNRAEGRRRSASPRRHKEDRENGLSEKRSRRRTPPPVYDSNPRGGIQRENVGKELFPSRPAPETPLNGVSKELFPNKQLAANLKKELFPSKAKTSHHRRSDAFDAADETADLFAKRLDLANAGAKNIKLVESSYGRLNSDLNPDAAIVDALIDDGLTIRGASKQQNAGYSIRGTATDGTRIGTIKELFPGKAGGNAGKELFAEKLQGRGGKRNKAEDMFY